MSYGNLAERMVHTFLDTFPSFVPAEQGPTLEAQEEFYQFMRGLYQRLLAEPTLLVRDLHEDDAHPNRFNKGSYGKPKLKVHMRRVLKEVDALLGILFLLGKSGRVEHGVLVVDEPIQIKARHRRAMEQLGLRVSEEQNKAVFAHDRYTDLPTAWSWMASRPGSSLLSFSRCMFEVRFPYARQIYAAIAGDEGAYRRLVSYLEENGYTYMQNLDGAVSMDYVKPHDGRVPTKGGFQYGIRHIGLSASYDVLVRNPAVFGLCIPQMKRILDNFARMDTVVQDFVAERTKKCDGCRYCVQTDKSGTHPLAFVAVAHRQETIHLCPYFPGYRYCWTRLDCRIVTQMIAMLDFMDDLLSSGPIHS
jgi:hypothetical protein